MEEVFENPGVTPYLKSYKVRSLEDGRLLDTALCYGGKKFSSNKESIDLFSLYVIFFQFKQSYVKCFLEVTSRGLKWEKKIYQREGCIQFSSQKLAGATSKCGS